MKKICSNYYNYKTWRVTDLPKNAFLGIKIRTDYNYQSLENSLIKIYVEKFH